MTTVEIGFERCHRRVRLMCNDAEVLDALSPAELVVLDGMIYITRGKSNHSRITFGENTHKTMAYEIQLPVTMCEELPRFATVKLEAQFDGEALIFELPPLNELPWPHLSIDAELYDPYAEARDVLEQRMRFCIENGCQFKAPDRYREALRPVWIEVMKAVGAI